VCWEASQQHLSRVNTHYPSIGAVVLGTLRQSASRVAFRYKTQTEAHDRIAQPRLVAAHPENMAKVGLAAIAIPFRVAHVQSTGFARP